MYEKWHTKTYTNIFRVINIASKQDEIILDGLIMWLHSCNKLFFCKTNIFMLLAFLQEFTLDIWLFP